MAPPASPRPGATGPPRRRSGRPRRRIRSEAHAALLLADRRRIERETDAARALTDAETWDGAWRTGVDLDDEAAIARALVALGASVPSPRAAGRVAV